MCVSVCAVYHVFKCIKQTGYAWNRILVQSQKKREKKKSGGRVLVLGVLRDRDMIEPEIDSQIQKKYINNGER